MNILLCVTGFFVCFSSFGMNNEYKKDSHIEENSQGIIGETLEGQVRNDGAISQIVDSINMQEIEKASNLLKQHSLDKTFLNNVFARGKESYTLLSYFLYFCENNMQGVVKNQEKDVAFLLTFLLSASKDQMDEKKYVGPCYIRKDDSRIIDVIRSAMDNERFMLAKTLIEECLKNKYLDAETV